MPWEICTHPAIVLRCELFCRTYAGMPISAEGTATARSACLFAFHMWTTWARTVLWGGKKRYTLSVYPVTCRLEILKSFLTIPVLDALCLCVRDLRLQ